MMWMRFPRRSFESRVTDNRCYLHIFMQVEVDNIARLYEGSTEPVSVEFPVWAPKELGTKLLQTDRVVSS